MKGAKRIYCFILLLCSLFCVESWALGYCFKNTSIRDQAFLRLNEFLLADESVQKIDEDCLFINLKNSKREELMEHLLFSLNPKKRKTQKTCVFELTEFQKTITQSHKIQFPRKTSINSGQARGQGHRTLKLEGLENKPLSLGLEDQRLFLICSPKGKTALIELKYQNDQGLSVSTSFEIQAGAQKEIAGLIEDLKQKDKQLDTDTGLRLEKENTKIQNTVILKLLSIQ